MRAHHVFKWSYYISWKRQKPTDQVVLQTTDIIFTFIILQLHFSVGFIFNFLLWQSGWVSAQIPLSFGSEKITLPGFLTTNVTGKFPDVSSKIKKFFFPWTQLQIVEMFLEFAGLVDKKAARKRPAVAYKYWNAVLNSGVVLHTNIVFWWLQVTFQNQLQNVCFEL